MGNANASEGAAAEVDEANSSGMTKEQSLEAMNAKLANKPFGNVGMERIGDKKILTQFLKLFYKGMKVKLYMYADEQVRITCHPHDTQVTTSRPRDYRKPTHVPPPSLRWPSP